MSPLATARRGRSVWLRVGLAATAALALAVLTAALELPSVGALLADLSDALGTWAYVLVPALAFFETAAFLGLLVPGETAVLVGGVVAERVHEQSKIRSGAADFPPLEMTG
jgi:Na+-translocating ferredoxin:NAD+ oxidoreductase RnfE subunit